MIESFRHRGLKRLYQHNDRSGIGGAMLGRVEEILSILDVAEAISEIDIPGYRLHPLTGDLKGYWSVHWRIVFRFEDGAVWDVDLLDYH
jgi:toxin HigB-1